MPLGEIIRSQDTHTGTRIGRRRFLEGVTTTGILLPSAFFLLSGTRSPEARDIEPYREQLAHCRLDGSGHNAGNIDEFPHDPQRLNRFLDSLVTDIELDLVCIRDRLYIGHRGDVLSGMFQRNPRLRHWQDAQQVVRRVAEKKKNIRFDRKRSTFTPHAQSLVANLMNQIPSNLFLSLSGTDWENQDDLKTKVTRDFRALRTINGKGRNTVDGYRKFTEHEGQTNPESYGVSIQFSLLNQKRIEQLREKGLYVLTYVLDDPEEVLQAHKFGASGVTSNRIDLLEAIGTAQAA